VTATKLPDGGSLVILDNPVDYAGPRPSRPASDPLRLGADRLRGDRYDHEVDTTSNRYVRLQVLDKSGAVVGESNPLWILREPPAHGIPEARRLSPRR
jgi:hypothetical protein